MRAQLNIAPEAEQGAISAQIEKVKYPDLDSRLRDESEAFDFPAYLSNQVEQTNLPEADINAMKPLRDRIIRLERDCRRTMKFTLETIDTLEDFEKSDAWKRFYVIYFPEDAAIQLPS